MYSALAAPGDEAPDQFTIHPDGSGLTWVTNLVANGGSAAEPTFTPDSARIVLATQLEPGGDVALAAVGLPHRRAEPTDTYAQFCLRAPRVAAWARFRYEECGGFYWSLQGGVLVGLVCQSWEVICIRGCRSGRRTGSVGY